jgi:hypothetical protein
MTYILTDTFSHTRILIFRWLSHIIKHAYTPPQRRVSKLHVHPDTRNQLSCSPLHIGWLCSVQALPGSSDWHAVSARFRGAQPRDGIRDGSLVVLLDRKPPRTRDAADWVAAQLQGSKGGPSQTQKNNCKCISFSIIMTKFPLFTPEIFSERSDCPTSKPHMVTAVVLMNVFVRMGWSAVRAQNGADGRTRDEWGEGGGGREREGGELGVAMAVVRQPPDRRRLDFQLHIHPSPLERGWVNPAQAMAGCHPRHTRTYPFSFIYQCSRSPFCLFCNFYEPICATA